MLDLRNIVKTYKTGDETITALAGVSLKFRKNEFVSILGQSGCGKTTLLNIVGGLDRYDEGDLIICGKSTKKFKDADWDNYRNRRIGFVFQSYNLIPHQTVLSNVELALTLSGVSKAERRRRAVKALEQVGLGDQLKKKPNQMSGGQMQRVAIARALVNNPEILLADEPTGALDSETSLQIMELLKEVAKDRLVIMVTHNPELAEQYSTRIIRLLDGKVIGDSDPCEELEDTKELEKPKSKRKKEKTSMSFFTALSLSFNNLLTKKARTIMTSFAGSIGIIGIALILSVSTGVKAYIDDIENTTMSSYPITINETAVDTTTMMASMMIENKTDVSKQLSDRVYSNNVMTDMMEMMTSGFSTNNLTAFKAFLEDDKNGIDKYVNDIKYSYNTGFNIYKENADGTFKKGLVSFEDLYAALGLTQSGASGQSPMASGMSSVVWTELVGDSDYIKKNYTLVHGDYPKNPTDLILIVNEDMQVTDYTLYSLGICDTNDLKEFLKAAGQSIATNTENDYVINAPTSFSFDELLNTKFRILTNADLFSYDETKKVISPIEGDNINSIDPRIITKLKDATELNIVGIVKANDDSAMSGIGSVGYTSDLMELLIDKVNENPLVKAQIEAKDVDLFSGMPFGKTEFTPDEIRAMMANDPSLSQYASLSDAELMAFAQAMSTDATYESNLEKLGFIDRSKPDRISIYPKDFEAKDEIAKIIENYNKKQDENDKITYTDTVKMLMSSVTTIVDAISYVLIAFVAISLIVSSIMIGIITYISVLERTKEIGILRSIGASKRDISNVFNAETTIVGLTAGVLGIVVTLLMLIPINAILYHLTEIEMLKAQLPTAGAISLIIISVLLTLIAGLVPSRLAAKRDPVEALRTE